MSGHAELLDQYKRDREVRFRLNNLLLETMPKGTLNDCAQTLGYLRKGTLIFDSEHETAVLMDYCLYAPGRDGRNLVARYLEESPPAANSAEMAALESMTRAYYSIFQVVDVERGVGVAVRDLLRDEPGFIVDVGFGSTALRNMGLASRVIPKDGYLVATGAALPLDAGVLTRVVRAMSRAGFTPGTFDFRRMSTRTTAELAATVIRECRSAGMASRIAYAEPGERPDVPAGGAPPRRAGRNDPCPCGSGRKFKVCCGRDRG